MQRVLKALMLFLLLALRPPQRGEPTVSASLASGVVKLGERTAIIVSVEQSGGGGVSTRFQGELPAVDGLELGPVSGPQTSSFQQRSGRRNVTLVTERWVIPVRPMREGEFEIPGLKLSVNGAERATEPVRLKVVADLSGADLGLLEVRPSATRVVESQPFTVEVRFGWDASLGSVNFADLSLGFFGGLPGTVAVETDFPPPGARKIEKGVTVNAASEVVVEELDPVELNGRSFRQLRLLRSFLPTRAGRIEIPESFLNFGTLEERGDFFSRRAVKVKDFYVSAPRVYVEVVALPEAGQPVDFTGAVGSLAAKAAVDRRDVNAGESIKLTVEWTGAGNLEFFEAPDLARLDAFRGFRVYGRTEEKAFGKRTTVYDVAPQSAEVQAVPAVPLWVFDPEREVYAVVETAAIPIRVRPLAAAVALSGESDAAPDAPARDLNDIEVGPLEHAQGAARAPSRGLVGGVLLGAPLLGLALRAAARRRGDPAAPRERRRRGARRKLARALASAVGPEDELLALQLFLAERSGEPEQAWVGRDPVRAFAERPPGREPGPDREAGRELAALLSRLERAAWSQEGGRVGAAEILATADRLLGSGL